jgi:hypothetical protein
MGFAMVLFSKRSLSRCKKVLGRAHQAPQRAVSFHLSVEICTDADETAFSGPVFDHDVRSAPLMRLMIARSRVGMLC